MDIDIQTTYFLSHNSDPNSDITSLENLYTPTNNNILSVEVTNDNEDKVLYKQSVKEYDTDDIWYCPHSIYIISKIFCDCLCLLIYLLTCGYLRQSSSKETLSQEEVFWNELNDPESKIKYT